MSDLHDLPTGVLIAGVLAILFVNSMLLRLFFGRIKQPPKVTSIASPDGSPASQETLSLLKENNRLLKQIAEKQDPSSR